LDIKRLQALIFARKKSVKEMHQNYIEDLIQQNEENIDDQVSIKQ
jgi:hypothetical protein